MVKKLIKIALIFPFALFIIVCAVLYFNQEKIIFHPEKLDKNFQFNYNQKFEEINLKTEDGVLLNGLLFKADSTNGVILYLHGNKGSLSSWGDVAKTYTDLNFDVYILDYRGFGKSEGTISSETLLFQDIQTAYTELKKRYNENNIIVLGYSIGTGPAAKIASENNPKLLILQAPYYSLTDMMRQYYSYIPTFLLKYKLETNVYLKNCKMPIVIFHGNQDEIISFNSSLKLQEEFKNTDTLITLNGMGHNGMTHNPDYLNEIRKILKR